MEQQTEISTYWHLADELNIVQAALLIIGEDPEKIEEFIEGWDCCNQPAGYGATKQAVSVALRLGLITGHHVPLYDRDINGNEAGEKEGTTDLGCSRVERESLIAWLASRGIKTGFFFPEKPTISDPDYLNPEHPRYAPKLAAAVAAWLACEEADKGKTPKQTLDKWLRLHAVEYGFTDDEGNIRTDPIAEISRVANWDTKGGAPKTPTK